MPRSCLVVCCAAAFIAAAQQPAPRSLITEARISPDGQSIAFARQAGVAGQPLGVFRITFGGLSETRVAGPDGVVSDLQWSPAGDSVAYISRGASNAPGRLRIVAATGAEPRTISTAGRDVTAYQWSTDGRRVLYESAPEANASGARQINVATVTAGESTAPFPSRLRPLQPADAITPIRDATIVFVTPVTDRQQSVTLSNGKETWIDLIYADGTRITVMPSGMARIVAPPSWSADGTRFAVIGSPEDGPPEIFAGSLPRPQPTGFNVGAVPPMVRQVTGAPR